MRRALVLILALTGCGRDARQPESQPTVSVGEADPIVIRVPRSGGTARAAVYPALDSVIWEATGIQRVERILGFDRDAGLIALVSRGEAPAHFDLRLGTSTVAHRGALRSLSSANGSDIFGVDTSGSVLRLNRAGRWSFTPPIPARAVYPQPDGALIIAATSGTRTTLWRMYPPDDQLVDTASFAPLGRSVGTQLGDRLYFTTDTAVVAVTARTLESVRSVRTRAPVSAAAATPSGDRLYLVSEGDPRLHVISRYAEGRATEIVLPGEATDLRMDPLGRHVLVRAAASDSAWVIAVGTGRLVATVATRWEADLPAVAPDGAIAALGTRNVTFIDPESGRETLEVSGGAADFWIFIFWNGFRPRAAGLDTPVAFPTEEWRPESLPDEAAESDPMRADARPDVPVPQLASPGFTVSFAAFLAAERAQLLAESISVRGSRAHVVATPAGATGAMLHRVVLGPYATREEAEAAARASQRPYWIFEGQP